MALIFKTLQHFYAEGGVTMPEAKATSPQTYPRVVPPLFLLYYGVHSFYLAFYTNFDAFWGFLRLHQTGLKPIQDGNLEPLFSCRRRRNSN